MAIFTVNKAAKRYRDAASKSYDANAHGFATVNRERKEDLYALKDRGINSAVSSGRLKFTGMHGRFAIYRGEGYCFHSTLIPKDADTNSADHDVSIFVESSPKKATEGRLKDARFTLEKCNVNEDSFMRCEPPTRGESAPETQYSPSIEDRDGDDEWDECDEFNAEFGCFDQE